MFNNSGISKVTGAAPTQILADVNLQSSVGCIVAQEVGTVVGAKKVAKAGTPIVLDYANLQTPATAGTTAATAGTTAASTGTANAVLLHDVDVTAGNANGTALIIGVVNVNRLESDVQSKVRAGINVAGGVSFIKA